MSRKTGYQPKTRNSYQRKRKSVVLLVAEGKNKTETQYFKSIPSPDHVIRFAPGNYTDPVNMVYALRKEYEELELDAELGDAAFCLVDSYEANMQQRDLYGSLYTIENSDVQPWSGFEKWLKIKHIRTLKLSESQGIYDCR